MLKKFVINTINDVPEEIKDLIKPMEDGRFVIFHKENSLDFKRVIFPGTTLSYFSKNNKYYLFLEVEKNVKKQEDL